MTLSDSLAARSDNDNIDGQRLSFLCHTPGKVTEAISEPVIVSFYNK